jgi:hypothetical protein
MTSICCFRHHSLHWRGSTYSTHMIDSIIELWRCHGAPILFPSSSTESLLDDRCFDSESCQRNMPGYISCSWDHPLHVIETTTHISTMVPMIYQRCRPRFPTISGPISFHWCFPLPGLNDWTQSTNPVNLTDRQIMFPPSFRMQILTH